jgi:uncharacterized membrane protein YhaH (DUF805 family)
MNPNQVRQVAERQRSLVWAIFAALLLNFANIFSAIVRRQPEAAADGILTLILMCLALLGQLWALLCVINLMAALGYDTGIRILLIILMFIPCVSLIVLLSLNVQATKFLRARGLRVGLMGVDPKDIPPPAI